MHKSHQTRLTGLSNQLNEQHANQIAAIKQDYETQLNELQETLTKLQEPNLDAEKLVQEQKQELLAKIEELEALSAESKTGFEEELAQLKSASTAQLEELAATHKLQLEEVSNALKV
jgi:ABC-type dipeptide/oligopeptide/nickel transport system ATPase subunit